MNDFFCKMKATSSSDFLGYKRQSFPLPLSLPLSLPLPLPLPKDSEIERSKLRKI